MKNMTSRIVELCARDVMNPRVVMLEEETPLDQAALTLLDQQISGAPVKNSDGELTGLLSLSDLAHPRPPHHETQRVLLQEDPVTHTSVLGKARQIKTQELVRDRMSRKLVSVSPETPLVDIARMMCDGHWHRVAVLDDRQKIVGMVSTMDVLSALVQAFDEARQ